ncbi:MAG: BrnT family toxin [Pirellulales bacterium]|nr:BrnT family toxin [Pirellulales bacterium]
MRYFAILWDLEDEPDGNTRHIAEHGITRDEVEEVLEKPFIISISRTTGQPIAFSETNTGRYIAIVYQEVDSDTVRPITAYEIG